MNFSKAREVVTAAGFVYKGAEILASGRLESVVKGEDSGWTMRDVKSGLTLQLVYDEGILPENSSVVLIRGTIADSSESDEGNRIEEGGITVNVSATGPATKAGVRQLLGKSPILPKL